MKLELLEEVLKYRKSTIFWSTRFCNTSLFVLCAPLDIVVTRVWAIVILKQCNWNTRALKYHHTCDNNIKNRSCVPTQCASKNRGTSYDTTIKQSGWCDLSLSISTYIVWVPWRYCTGKNINPIYVGYHLTVFPQIVYCDTLINIHKTMK